MQEGLHALRRRLPPDWTAGQASVESHPSATKATLEVTAPDRRVGLIAVLARSRLDPKGVRTLVEAIPNEARLRSAPVVVARYLSAATRACLRDGGVGYLDLTGNVWIVMPQPGLYIETQGASEDPDREERPARSLRGLKAGRIVRALIDRKDVIGVRALASLTKIDAGYVSRVLTLLDSQALITRDDRGRLKSVAWPGLLRLWAQEAPLESRGEIRTFLEPRGLSVLLARLAKSDARYVATGGLAATTQAPIAPPRLGIIWMDDAAAAAEKLGLRSANVGANVMLIEPADESVYEGAILRAGVRYAAPSQVAVDLLTSPGRGPAEGEALIEWMQANEEAWRQ